MQKERSVTFYKPSNTLSVSLTGKECMLNCSHCGGHYLERMIPINTFMDNISKYAAYKSLLLSGGCNQSGSVDLTPHFETLKTIVKHGFGLNFHTGLVSKETLKIIQELSILKSKDREIAVSFDFVTDDETINKVYGIDKTGDDYIDSYIALKKMVTVIPHICIGLFGGNLKGELSALNKLAQIGTQKVVLIIFIPTKNTAFETCSPPSLNDIELVFRSAKEIFCDVPIHLGCMRPSGKIRDSIDLLALSCGINHIVMPSKAVLSEALNLSLEIINKEECCVL